MQAIRYSREINLDFTKALKRRVRSYFKDNGISMTGNYKMYWKSAFMLSLYFVPYFVHLFLPTGSAWLHLLLWILMGWGMAGIGLSIMHDAVHGSYSLKKWVNQLMSLSMNITGGSYTNWRIKHNILHHTYTNVDGLDQDLEVAGWLLRFSPNKERHDIHKFQHIYAWFLYTLLTLLWTTVSDFKGFIKYRKKGMFRMLNINPKVILARITGSKIFYFAYILLFPMLISSSAWWVTLIGYVIMHLIAGFLLAIIFQPAHVMETSEFLKAPEDGTVNQSIEAHQLYTTTNFATKNKLLTWFAGGLNFQIEHHLFPNICHIHYKKISEIVKQTAKEFKLPYHEIETFRLALRMHGNMLYALGRA